MKLYDSLSQESKRLKEGKVTIYLCGPTVYDDIHIGNIFPVVIFDFLIRYLREKNIEYTYIHNITDIDDKIIAKAKQLNTTEEEIANTYTQRYLDIFDALGIITPTHMPKVSENITEIHNVIQQLMNKGYAEIRDEDVVFSLEKVEEYGELSKQKLNELTHVSDFCLWKRMTEGKRWDSPWGEGRPGWHTECFAFIDKYAGGKVDIHGGGIDLKFPHHENENAHCRAIYEQPLADIWIHVGHISTQEGKISKSTNHKYLVKDFFENYSPNLIRYMFLTSKYSLPSVISEEKLNCWNEELRSFIFAINKSKSILYLSNKELNENVEIDPEFMEALEKNLNMPELLTWMQKLKKELLTNIKKNEIDSIEKNSSKLLKHLKWLGFAFEDIHTEENKKLLKEWKAHKDNKNYQETDRLRDILISRGLL